MNRKAIAFTVMICFVFSAAVCLITMADNGQTSGVRLLGRMCIAQVYPGSVPEAAEAEEPETTEEPKITATVVKQTKKVETKKTAVDNSRPQVIIYHTHSSESYQQAYRKS